VNKLPKLTPKDLVAFEEKVADKFNAGMIKAPVHLYHGNEEQMISIFSEVNPEDWVLCSWRSHYQCLLKGVPEDEILEEILKGRSISLCFPKYRIFSSAIVTGVLPIAVGIALSIKRNKGQNKVHVFLGEMTSETGLAHECIKYSTNHELPIRFIIEDNGKSVCTDTREVWNLQELTYEKSTAENIYFYKYNTIYPHAGAGKRVQF